MNETLSKEEVWGIFLRGKSGRKSPTLKWGTAANAVNSWSSFWPTTANAHAVMASSCSANSHKRRSAAAANAVNSCSSFWPIVANAHAVVASPCYANSHKRRSAAAANTVNSCSSS